MSQLRCMDLQTLGITADMVGKLYRLACDTMSTPDNDDCEMIATNLLDAAIDAALEKCQGGVGVLDLDKAGVKFELLSPLPAERRQQEGGSCQ
jgi:hypothetical protein